MLLYHGSYMEIREPDLYFGRFNLDFGKGFYVTGLKSQAEKWALRRAMTSKQIEGVEYTKAMVNIYEMDFKNTGLSILSFDGYTEQWLNYIVANRGMKEPISNSQYDIIYGNVADDDVAQAVDGYMELLRKNRVNRDVKNALLYQLKFSKPNDQYCFASGKSVKELRFIKCYEVVEGIQ